MPVTSNLQTPERRRQQYAGIGGTGALVDVNAYGARESTRRDYLEQCRQRRNLAGARRHG